MIQTQTYAIGTAECLTTFAALRDVIGIEAAGRIARLAGHTPHLADRLAYFYCSDGQLCVTLGYKDNNPELVIGHFLTLKETARVVRMFNQAIMDAEDAQ